MKNIVIVIALLLAQLAGAQKVWSDFELGQVRTSVMQTEEFRFIRDSLGLQTPEISSFRDLVAKGEDVRLHGDFSLVEFRGDSIIWETQNNTTLNVRVVDLAEHWGLYGETPMNVPIYEVGTYKIVGSFEGDDSITLPVVASADTKSADDFLEEAYQKGYALGLEEAEEKSATHSYDHGCHQQVWCQPVATPCCYFHRRWGGFCGGWNAGFGWGVGVGFGWNTWSPWWGYAPYWGGYGAWGWGGRYIYGRFTPPGYAYGRFTPGYIYGQAGGTWVLRNQPRGGNASGGFYGNPRSGGSGGNVVAGNPRPKSQPVREEAFSSIARIDQRSYDRWEAKRLNTRSSSGQVQRTPNGAQRQASPARQQARPTGGSSGKVYGQRQARPQGRVASPSRQSARPAGTGRNVYGQRQASPARQQARPTGGSSGKVYGQRQARPQGRVASPSRQSARPAGRNASQRQASPARQARPQGRSASPSRRR